MTTLDQLRDALDPIAEHAHQRLLRDGRGSRTVTVKLKKADMSTLTRSATLPYATTDVGALLALARRLLLDPVQIGPIRLLGVGFSGLSEVRQESLFPDLDLAAETSEEAHQDFHPSHGALSSTPAGAVWRIGDDVTHRELGHGWVQGAGHGVVTVRFETRGSGPGPARTFPIETSDITAANPVDSLDWPDFVGQLRVENAADTSTPAVDDLDDG
ncbi:DinB/UmuC family translesion DNA polymerase [Mycobacterium marinum]|uniref:DinB/UmuC family translesion DNA polymerase n=1 Tax=Mycobacterium marinum TaxID=1781 RepID=UPI00402A26B8